MLLCLSLHTYLSVCVSRTIYNKYTHYITYIRLYYIQTCTEQSKTAGMQWHAIPALCTDRERLQQQHLETYCPSLPKCRNLSSILSTTNMQEHVQMHICPCTCTQEVITTIRKHHSHPRNIIIILEEDITMSLLTVKIVGVTNAQQTRQNLLGWNPIIISISSQNLCNPVSSKRKCN